MYSPRKYFFQLLNARSVRNKVDLITQLSIDSNCSISAITETWLTIDDSALASQLTPDGIKVSLANKYTSHRRGGLALLLSSELKIISSSTPCFSSYEIMICNIQFPSLFTIIIILIYISPSFDLISFKFFDRFTRKKKTSTKSSYFTDMLSSYGISSKQAYKLSFTLVGKTQTKHLSDQPNLVLCSLFANFFQQKMSSIINVLPNIKSAQLNLNLTSTHNHCSCFSLPTHDILLSLITSLKTNSHLDPIPLNLLHSFSPYFIGLIV